MSNLAIWGWDGCSPISKSSFTHQQRAEWGVYVIGFEDGRKGQKGVPEFCRWPSVNPLAYRWRRLNLNWVKENQFFKDLFGILVEKVTE